MGLMESAKNKLKKAKDVTVNKLHERKGRLEGRHDQAKVDKRRQSEYSEYEPEEKNV